jgi:predicted enzyme related to lactoylglutathione lyase
MAKRRPKKSSSAAIKVRAVDFVVYNASNMKRSKRFYSELLGLKRGGEFTSFWAEFATKPTTLCLCAPDKGSKWRGKTAIALAVDDVYAAVEKLRKRGVRILMPATTTGVCHMAFIADPDGNRICLHQRKDGTAG